MNIVSKLFTLVIIVLCLLVSAAILEVYQNDFGFLRYASGYFFAMLGGALAVKL